MEDMVKTIGSYGYEDIQKIKSGVGKTETRIPAMKLLKTLGDFHCERTNTSYGDTSTWGDDRALIFDSLSGLNLLSMSLTIGYKPAAHQGEWGVAMNFVEQLILKMSSDRNCFFTMTSHIEREMNEITGVTQVMAATLGRKLAPKIPRFFSEVVLAKRAIADGKASFTWSTLDPSTELKNRALPISSSLVPSYVPIVTAFRNRKSLASGTATAASGTPPPVEKAPTNVVRPPTSPMQPAKVAITGVR
jgi:hypothetical protein